MSEGAQGLGGIRIIEAGGGVAASLAGRLLADLGATVVKLEPSGGDPVRQRGPFAGDGPAGERSGLFTVLNAGKRSLVADLHSAAGRDLLDGLVPHADLLIHSCPPKDLARCGLAWERLSALNPALVVLAVSPFGHTGPYRDFVAADLNLIHAGGWGWLCPGPGTDPSLPPIKPFGQHAWVQSALHGAVAALGALFAARATGQGEHIDLSAQEAVLTVTGRNFISTSYGGQIDGRLSPRAYAPNGFFPCRDGYLYLVCIEEEQWQRLVELMGAPAWASEQRFATKDIRGQHEAELNVHLREWIGTWAVEELFKACQERRICACPVYRSGQLAGQEHLKAREFPHLLEQPGLGKLRVPGPPYRLLHSWWEPRGAAPRLGEAQALGARALGNGAAGKGPAGNGAPANGPLGHGALGSDRAALAPVSPANGGQGVARPAATTAGNGHGNPPRPLTGVKVLDFTWVWAGPHCTRLLSDLGADVVKVESAARLDLLRRGGVWARELEPGVNRRGTFNQLGQGKRSLQLSLIQPEGLALARRLAEQADVVVSNFGTGVMERFGLGAEALLKLKPELIVCAISGFGQTGPYRHYMGYGQAAVPLSGISALTGYRPGEPQEVHIAYGDPVSGVFGALGIAAALVARQRHGGSQEVGGGQRNGGGQFIDVSLWEALVWTSLEAWMPAALPEHPRDNPPLAPMGNRDPWWAPHNCYRCAGEDAWVSIAVTEEAQWPALCAALGQPALAEDARFRTAPDRKAHEDALDALIGAWTRGLERWEVTRRLQAAGVGAFPSLNAQELADDPHLAARGYFGLAPHPEVGVRAHLGVPWRMTRRPSGACGPAPLLGQHTDEVLRDWLGADAAQLAAWRAAGVLT